MPRPFKEAFKKNLDNLLNPEIIYKKLNGDPEDYYLCISTTFITIEYEAKTNMIKIRDPKKWCIYKTDSSLIFTGKQRYKFNEEDEFKSLFEFIRNRTLETGSPSHDHSIYKATTEVSRIILNKVKDYLSNQLYLNQEKY